MDVQPPRSWTEVECPYCGEGAVAPLRKMVLGPAIPVSCEACGGKVGVPLFSALLAFIPFGAAVFLSDPVDEPLQTALAWVGGLTVSLLLYVFWVPLEPRA